MWWSEGILKFLEAIVPAFSWLLCVILFVCKPLALPNTLKNETVHVGIFILGHCVPVMNLRPGLLRAKYFYLVVI